MVHGECDTFLFSLACRVTTKGSDVPVRRLSSKKLVVDIVEINLKNIYISKTLIKVYMRKTATWLTLQISKRVRLSMPCSRQAFVPTPGGQYSLSAKEFVGKDILSEPTIELEAQKSSSSSRNNGSPS